MAIPVINLLKTKGAIPPHIAAIETQLRTASYIAVTLVLGAGISLGTVLYIFNQEKATLEESQRTLTGQIVTQSKKEGMFTSLKQRVVLADKVFAVQRSYGPMMETIEKIAKPPQLASVSMDEQKKVSLVIRTNSLEEIASMVGSVVELVIQKKFTNPTVVSLQVDKDGKTQIELSFIPFL